MAVQKYLYPFYLEHKILKILKKEKLSKSLPTVENVGLCVTFPSSYTYNVYWKDLCSKSVKCS